MPFSNVVGNSGLLSAWDEPPASFPIGGLWIENESTGFPGHAWIRHKDEFLERDGWISLVEQKAHTVITNLTGTTTTPIALPLDWDFTILPTGFTVQNSPVPAVNPTGANSQVNSSTNYWTFALQQIGGGVAAFPIASVNTQNFDVSVANWNYRMAMALSGWNLNFFVPDKANGYTRFQVVATKTGASSYQLNAHVATVSYRYYRTGYWLG